MIENLIVLSWRAYPAGMLIAAGLMGAVWSARRGVLRARQQRDPGRALAIMQGFRRSVVCLAAAAIGAAWWWQIGWLFVLALVIGGEELLESTVVITALKHGPLGPRAARPPSTTPARCQRAGRPRSQGRPHAAASQRAIVVSRSGGSGMA